MKAPLLPLLLLALAGCQPEGAPYHGYVEGEYLYIAPTTAGVLKTLSVTRGQDVKQGAPLFALDATELEATLAAAKAAAARAKASWQDLTKGNRPEEIDVIAQEAEQARANLDSAEKEFKRAQGLLASGASSKADFDIKKASFEAATARVAEMQARLKTAQLGGRDDAQEAARAAYDEALQAIVQAERHLIESAPNAPASGRIEDTYYHAGEYIKAGAPVVSLLPPENVKVLFYAPQKDIPHLSPGTPVTLTCDGCAAPIAAKITYIASQSEYTPPVIYSVESRDKLVFRVEAVPLTPVPTLRPGLPLDIAPASKGDAP